MKILYLDCNMGAAGDMLAAALLELMPDREKFVEKLNSIGIPGVKYVLRKSEKCGICGTHLSVMVDGKEEGAAEHGHHEDSEATDPGPCHHDMHSITDVINDLKISDDVRKDVTDVYGILAEAESRVHGMTVSDIHFHEVGTKDAIADITAFCLLINELSPDIVAASPIHVGSGSVKCAHGILPVPAPATAQILKGIPIYSGKIQGELCTPTGAALLKHFVSSFGEMPVMSVERIGYGMGTKDFEIANCLRTFYGNSNEGSTDTVAELEFNVDDMTAEEIGFAVSRLYEAGAREVFTVPAYMKKNRPGTLVCVICDADKVREMAETIFRNTTTIGIRQSVKQRYILDRTFEEYDTPYGTVRKKVSLGYGCLRSKYEYDDIAKIARERNISFRDAEELL